MKFNMEFFNNKRLLVILSGVASIMIALVIFVMSMIGFGNISAFMFGSKDTPELTAGPSETGSSITPSSETPSISPTYSEYTDTYTDTATQSISDTPSQDTQTPSDNTQTTNPATESPDISASVSPSEIKVTSMKINQGSSITLKTGASQKLTASVTPSNSSAYTLKWTSLNPSVLFVAEDGTVMAVSETKATAYVAVRCYSKVNPDEQWAIAQIQVNVVPETVSVTNVYINNSSGTTSLNIGESIELNAIIQPDKATDKTVKWTSSNTSVAAVSSSGNSARVTAKAPGETTITLTASNGVKATLKIKVLDNTTVEPPDTDPGTQ